MRANPVLLYTCSTSEGILLACNVFAFQSSLIGCVGVGAMLYQFFPSLVNGHLLTEYEIFISHLVGSCNTKPEIVCLCVSGIVGPTSRQDWWF